MSQPDETMAKIGAAIELGRAGRRAEARDTFDRLWDEIGPHGDAFHRCALAHYMADLQETDEAELEWDERALDAASGLTDERAQQFHESLQVQGFLPSLHLNLADDHRRLGDADRARKHLEIAEDCRATSRTMRTGARSGAAFSTSPPPSTWVRPLVSPATDHPVAPSFRDGSAGQGRSAAAKRPSGS